MNQKEIQTIPNTQEEFDNTIATCRNLFEKKLIDYGTSWRVMRPSSLTDQIYIKARRIRSFEKKGELRVNEGIEPEYIAIVNYCVIALIVVELEKEGHTDMECPLDANEALQLYDKVIERLRNLLKAKNHDYDEAWRHMRVSSFTDIILQKLLRTKEIEDHKGHTLVSEGVEGNYLDIINYSVFALIKLSEQR